METFSTLCLKNPPQTCHIRHLFFIIDSPLQFLHWMFPRHFFHSAAHPQTWHSALTFHCKHLAGQIKMYNRLTLGSAGSDSGYLAYLFSSRMWTHTHKVAYMTSMKDRTLALKGCNITLFALYSFSTEQF